MSPAKAPENTLSWGAYVHFPWCLKKCPYCDFLSVPVEPRRLVRLQPRPHQDADASPSPSTVTRPRAALPVDAITAREVLPHAAYADAVLEELEARRIRLALDTRPRSIFFGGGTPSLWEPSQLGRIIAALHGVGPACDEPEVTVECNPTSFDEEHARRLLDVGVNRISLGVQSLDEERLRFLGRLHDAGGALRSLAAAQRVGVPRVNADMIFGAAGQSPESAAAEVRRVAETGITHVSAYALTIEPNTHFGLLARRGKLPLLADELIAESFVAVDETLRSLGFAHYEVSNYAREGHTARHNLGYWRGHDYLGLGVGAWGTVRLDAREPARLRYRNTPSVERYLEGWTGLNPTPEARSLQASDPFSEGPLLAERELIDPETALRERLLLGLRLEEGLDVDGAAAELGVTPWTPPRARARDRLLQVGRLEQAGGRLRIPPSQWLFADGIVAELL